MELAWSQRESWCFLEVSGISRAFLPAHKYQSQHSPADSLCLAPRQCPSALQTQLSRAGLTQFTGPFGVGSWLCSARLSLGLQGKHVKERQLIQVYGLCGNRISGLSLAICSWHCSQDLPGPSAPEQGWGQGWPRSSCLVPGQDFPRGLKRFLPPGLQRGRQGKAGRL